MILKLKDEEVIMRIAQEKGYHIEHGYDGTHINMGKAGDYFLRKGDVIRGTIQLDTNDIESAIVDGVSVYLVTVGYKKKKRVYPKFIFVEMKDKLDTLLKEG